MNCNVHWNEKRSHAIGLYFHATASLSALQFEIFFTPTICAVELPKHSDSLILAYYTNVTYLLT